MLDPVPSVRRPASWALSARRRSFEAALPRWAWPCLPEPLYDTSPPVGQRALKVAVARGLAAVGLHVVEPPDPAEGGVVLGDAPHGDGVYVEWLPHPVLLVDRRHETTAHVVAETMSVALQELLVDLGFAVSTAGPYGVPLVLGRVEAPDDPQPPDDQDQTALNFQETAA